MANRSRLKAALVLIALPVILPAMVLCALALGIWESLKETASGLREILIREVPKMVRYVMEPVGPALRRSGRSVRTFLVLDVYARFLAVLLIPVSVSLWLLSRVLDIRGTKYEAREMAAELVRDTFTLLYRGAHIAYFETAQNDRIEVARRELTREAYYGA